MLFEAWFFDVYPVPGGMATWWIGEDGARPRLRDPWRPALYVDAAAPGLPMVRRRLETDPRIAEIRLERRREFWNPTPAPVRGLEVVEPQALGSLARELGGALGPSRLFNADLPLGQRYCYERALYPLARCRVEARGGALSSVARLRGGGPAARRAPPPASRAAPAPARVRGPRSAPHRLGRRLVASRARRPRRDARGRASAGPRTSSFSPSPSHPAFPHRGEEKR